ncbi:hypothetical protein RN001_004549 [Aquatica leii]|uniref:Tetratricopeptide repeat protein 21B n=1 Tax=Aquatica leii TaxID=1421715 RepID=A0AAN7P5H1_9COLE|nr:hypothetical protein RN001_004549 [Aquatica leii]
MDEQDLKGIIFYFCRERYYNRMLKACQDGINRFRGDLSFNLYNCIALILCGQFEESIGELNILKSENDYRLTAVRTLAEVYKIMGSTENDAFTKLEQRIHEFKHTASPVDFCNVAFVLFAMAQYEHANEYIDNALESNPSDADFLCLKGWIQLYLVKNRLSERFKVSRIFDKALADDRKNFSCSLGIVESYMLEENFDDALSLINKIVVRFPSTTLGLMQKMRLHFALQSWEQCLDTIKRISVLEPDNAESLKYHILILICNESKFEEAASYIRKFTNILFKLEPENGDLFVENAQLFSRVCGRNKLVLAETYKMVEKALEISVQNITYMAELAYQCILAGNIKDAVRLYKSAAKIDDSSLDVLIGMTLCELLEFGINDHVKHQVNFLIELEESQNKLQLLFLKAKLGDRNDTSLAILFDICDMQLNKVMCLPYGSEYLFSLDVDFLLTVCKELFFYLPQVPALITKEKHMQKPSAIAKRADSIFNALAKACPSLQEAKYLLATVQFLNGDVIKAKSNLELILTDVNTNFVESYLLMAQIQLYVGQYERAAQSLEIGLSHNFSVRDKPLYHFISGIIEKNRNNHDEAITFFKAALQVANGKDTISSLTLYDKATIYLELIDSHMQGNQLHEASKLINAVVEEFRGTSEEARIVILNAEQAIEKNEIQRAIDLLTHVQPKESYYLQAKTKLANILLEYRHDEKAYLQIYLEMVEVDPGPESFILLADAYFNTLEIEKALEMYEKAVSMNPKDAYLCSKMGKALVKSHYYAKAITYYQEAIKLTDSIELKLQLTDLHMKLQQYDKAEILLISEIENENAKNEEDLLTLQYKTKLMIMISEIYRSNGNSLGAQKMLRTAKENQHRVIKRLSLDYMDALEEEHLILKDICKKLSVISVLLKDNEGATSLIKEALSLFPDDIELLATLAKLYIQTNNLELCQQTCAALSKLDPDNEDASVMLADIAFRKIDFTMSSFHFTHLLSKQPTNWKALVRYIEVMRRTGELDEIIPYLQQAELTINKSFRTPGFSYATALFQWYTGNLNAALRNFNNARLDSEWGKKALCNMIEICLNPDDEILGEQFFDVDDTEYRDSRSMALKTAERLLKELKQKSTGLDEENFKHRLLGNFLMLATKDKTNIEKALADFTSLASNDLYREEIGPILGMATAHTMLKQSQRAKNQLKRVIKSIWTFEDAEYLERCWLLLADYYIQSSKYETATEILKRILEHNKTCTKAYELLGFIAEKEQTYKEACSYYDSAWKYSGKMNPSIGYKLAYNFMKSKRHAEAIDVCQQVLKNHPDYPRIRKDILDKCMNNLRT